MYFCVRGCVRTLRILYVYATVGFILPCLADELEYTTDSGNQTLPLPHWRWTSVVHGCPPLVIGTSLLLLSVVGTVYRNTYVTSVFRTFYIVYVCFPKSPQGFSLLAFIPMTFAGHFNRCFLLTYSGSEQSAKRRYGPLISISSILHLRALCHKMDSHVTMRLRQKYYQ